MCIMKHAVCSVQLQRVKNLEGFRNQWQLLDVLQEDSSSRSRKDQVAGDVGWWQSTCLARIRSCLHLWYHKNKGDSIIEKDQTEKYESRTQRLRDQCVGAHGPIWLVACAYMTQGARVVCTFSKCFCKKRKQEHMEHGPYGPQSLKYLLSSPLWSTGEGYCLCPIQTICSL